MNIVNMESIHLSSIYKCGNMLILKGWSFNGSIVLMYYCKVIPHSFVSPLTNCAFVHTDVLSNTRKKNVSFNPRIALFSQRVFSREICPRELAQPYGEGSIAYDSTTA